MASTSRAQPQQPQTRIQLAPKAGFCIKTTTLAPAILPASATATQNTPNKNILEPPSAPRPIPQGTKVFVNIAWDANVPPPPEGSEEAVQRAMQGVDSDAQDAMAGPGEWYVPVIVSPPREDTDKAGKPSLVFDCIYNSSVKARTLRDPEFKVFLVELALQRIEAQTALTLSRAIAAPNIASKGKLAPRTVVIPTALLHNQGSSQKAQDTSSPMALDVVDSSSTSPPSVGKSKQGRGAPLIEEIGSPSAAGDKPASAVSTTSTALPGLKGILKKPLSTSAPPSASARGVADSAVDVNADVDESAPLEWDWTTTEKNKEGRSRLKITVRVPGATPVLVQQTTLDIGPRTLTLHIPKRAPLDLDLSLSDAEIVARTGSTYAAAATNDAYENGHTDVRAKRTRPQKNTSEERDRRRQAAVERALQLKRQRDFDVDSAEAEWRLGSGEVVIYV